MKPVRKRKLVDSVRSDWGVSIRRACRTLLVDTSTYHYKSRRHGQAPLEQRIKEICQTRVRRRRTLLSASRCQPSSFKRRNPGMFSRARPNAAVSFGGWDTATIRFPGPPFTTTPVWVVRTNLTEQQLKDAPQFSDDSWQDRDWETRTHRHTVLPPIGNVQAFSSASGSGPYLGLRWFS